MAAARKSLALGSSLLAGALSMLALAATAAAAAPAAIDADTALLDAWWDVVEMIDRDVAWEDCRAALDVALERYPHAAYVRQCRALREGVVQALAADAVAPTIMADADPVRLAAALPAARVSIGWVLMPLQYYAAADQTVWQFYADRAVVGPQASALMLCARGRSAIPALLTQLDNLTATRSVSPDRTRLATPVVLRVNDIALGLIEAISFCRFRNPPASFHQANGDPLVMAEWSAEARADLAASVREWWQATQDLSPEEAVLWRIRRANRDQQLEMLDVLIATGKNETALRFLYDVYRAGPALDERFSERMLRAGSRAPLDFLQYAVRQGRPVDHGMISLIAGFGDVQDFQLLRNLVVNGAVEGGPSAIHLDLPMLVNALNYADSEQCLPVLVAVIEKHRATRADASGGPGIQAPAYIGRAAERIETISGLDFGFDAREAPQRRQRAMDDILDWWNREGRGAYDYEPTKPHAPAGIR